MERRIAIAFILCAIIIIMPFAVKIAENSIKSSTEIPSSNITTTFGGITYIGSAVSHEGSDLLCVIPAKVYVPEAGTEVTLNVTVKFKHAQPCPYSDWEILTENPVNVEVVSESETKLTDAYTAVKQYTVKVLGNGALDVVFKYGSSCPYGTEERVTVYFYIGTPSEEEMVNASAQIPELNITEKIITGVIEDVNLEERYFVVNSTKIAVRGKWRSEEGAEYNWREMLALLKVGEKVEVKATYEDGEWKAYEITINGKTFVKG
ncbi:hypothetical protein E3E31_00740 [Thermococcus sp. M39]|uniref:DUF5666 domain-containing protein n=1 Tax=unclassified Thermococcus TaxID=2627626 RepID=UPI00143B5ED8|nr:MULTISPECIES: DUF5666 domain-containing protein [unclassified Thermococcus]NJE07081.1 hypothetical protein [Thermococcus sp. M39]NJE13619.1 hypothetical protein [Thermococcus sp. LS2]